VVILRRLVILVALLVPAVSTLAHIDPPDPTWVGGYWNDDDFDDAVDATLHHAAVPPASAPAVDGLCWITVARVEVLDVNGVAPSVATTDSPRGPPARHLALVTALPNS
jgi:hypothetical protein